MNKQYRFSSIDLVRLDTALDYFINNFFSDSQDTPYVLGVKMEYKSLLKRVQKAERECNPNVL